MSGSEPGHDEISAYLITMIKQGLEHISLPPSQILEAFPTGVDVMAELTNDLHSAVYAMNWRFPHVLPAELNSSIARLIEVIEEVAQREKDDERTFLSPEWPHIAAQAHALLVEFSDRISDI